MKFFSLSRKLLIMVVVTSGVFTTVTTVIQIALEYGSAKDEQASALEVFRSSALPSFQNLLWVFNQEALTDQLQKSLNSRDFVGIKVENDRHETQGEFRKDGIFQNRDKKIFELKNPTNEAETIGTVELEYTNDFIYTHVRWTALIILLSNSLKTLGVSVILLWLFRQHNVGRLKKISEHLGAQDWQRPSPYSSDAEIWPFINKPDEISQIVASLNDAVQIIEKNTDNSEARERNSSRLAELGILSSGIAHEINNPLAIILGSSAVLTKKMAKLNLNNPDVTALVASVEKSALRISGIISSLKYFARDGSADPMGEVSISELFTEIEPLCSAMLERKGVKFELQLADSSFHVNGRKAQVFQVLLNLINNSADAIDGLDEKWIRVSAVTAQNGGVGLTVTDSGRGIPEAVRDKMFLPFFTTKDVGKGTGLGLAIVYGIVRDHGGTIVVNGECANTEIIINLPKLPSLSEKRT